MDEITVGRYTVRTDRYYTKDHEWALIKGNKAWIGITDYAQKELGDIVYVDLPSVGQSFESADTIANIESVKNVAPVYAPLSGTVVEVNEQLVDEPHLINESPYDDGWIVVLELSDPMEVEDLMPAQDYAEILAEIVKEEKEEDVSLEIPEEEIIPTIEESLDALPEEEHPYEEKER